MGVQGVGLGVKADHVIGAGEDDPLDAVAPRCLVDVEGAADVRAQNRFEGMLGRHAAKVQDRVDPFDQSIDGLLVGQIANHDFFALRGGWSHVGNVRQAQGLGVRLEAFTQDLAQATGGAGQQQAVEGGRAVAHGVDPELLLDEWAWRLR